MIQERILPECISMYLYVDAEHHKAIPFQAVSLYRKPRPGRSCEEFPYADS
jgi:hypothetical protein